MSDKKNSLEMYIAEKLKEIDCYARPTKASGASTEIGDIKNNYFFVEAKQKHTIENFNFSRKKEWLKLLSQIPVDTQKIPILVRENKYGEKMVLIDLEDFFRLIYKIYIGE
jgi:hypothetical protein